MDALSTEDLIEAECVLYHHYFGYVKSMALSCAVHLSIPNTIYLRGDSATLSELIADAGLDASRLPNLQRLMNVLTISGVFTASHKTATRVSTTAGLSGKETVYKLTAASRLLVDGDKQRGMSPLLHFLVRPLSIKPFFGMHTWFKDEQAASKSFFEMAHGCDRWEMTSKNAEDNSIFNEAMVADCNLVMEIFLRGAEGQIFSPLSSLVDVGGGIGPASAAITRSFPHIKCTVLDLPHVVSQAPQANNGAVNFVAGDMFKFIPPADAVLLRCVLHCWGDDDCIKILRRCRDAIPAREDGGKVIIIDSVMGSGPQDTISKEAQALYDLYMMYINGVERGENEWRKIFHEAGFSDYRIISGLGIRSAIEVYP
ncbi:unnamed protein product [Urochloa humidicola]